jgi:hypothetical protein
MCWPWATNWEAPCTRTVPGAAHTPCQHPLLSPPLRSRRKTGSGHTLSVLSKCKASLNASYTLTLLAADHHQHCPQHCHLFDMPWPLHPSRPPHQTHHILLHKPLQSSACGQSPVSDALAETTTHKLYPTHLGCQFRRANPCKRTYLLHVCDVLGI